MNYDIIIIGGGPAGITAGIYALRANKKILILEKEVIGGKIASASIVENYPGIKEIKGSDLSESLREQILNLGGKIKTEEVTKIEDKINEKLVITKSNIYRCKSIIIATGTKYKTLGIENENKFIGKGISFCATCDGFFYKNKKVAVIGGGNTAVANAIELCNICEKVYLIQILDYLTAEEILKKQLEKRKNIEYLFNTTVKNIHGDNKLEEIQVETKNQSKTIKIDGIFISIGQIPETNIFKDIINLDEYGYIIVNEDLMTNQKGIFAVGDCINKKIRQLTTAVNDGTIASLNAIEYLKISNN